MTRNPEIPSLAFGTWKLPEGGPTAECVDWALEAGYRHIDTAQRYANENGVGTAIARSGLGREDVFVTTKFDPAFADPVAEAERSLERLGTDHVDLYLVHWPQGEPLRHWPGMVRAKELGLARAIGVSNYGAAELASLCASTDEPPTVNQVEINPFAYRRALIDACARFGIAVAAWGPLTHGRELEHPVVADIAGAAGRTPAQVLLRWAIQHDLIVITKSATRERISENARVFDFELTAEQMAALDALDRTGGTDQARERPSLLRRAVSRLRS